MQRHAILAVATLVALPACSGASTTGGGGGDGGATRTSSADGGGGGGGGIFGGGNAIGGNSGGGEGGSSGGQCIQTGNAGCDQCLDASCCAPIQACEGDRQCVSLYQCLSACSSGDQSCTDQCLSTYGEGKAALQQVLSCVDQACASPCS